MTQTAYLILGISILVALLAIFIISFVLYTKTPIPKGCETIKINEENCAGCNHPECKFYKSKEEIRCNVCTCQKR